MERRHRDALDTVLAALREEFGDGLAGLLLTGSLARGEGDEHSDLDLYVLVDRPWRQRRTRWVDGVEVELFLNPVARIDYALPIVDRVDHAMVADTNPPFPIAPLQLPATRRPWVGR